MSEAGMIRSDILIAGAGAAGIAAAIAAAREGKDVVLLERYGMVGGGMTATYVRPFLGTVGNPNIGNEIEERVLKYTSFMTPVESAKAVLAEMLQEAGVRVYLQTQVIRVEKEGRSITKIVASCQGNPLYFTADAYLDTTGDGNLSALAGAEFAIGREGDGLVQPVSTMFTIEGIDPDYGLLCEHEEHYTVLPNGKEYLDLCHKACESGELPPSINIVRLYATGKKGERMVNATQQNRVDPLSPEQLFPAEYALREQIVSVVRFLKKNIPGFENIRVNGSAVTAGIRESRRIIGDYELKVEDLFEGKRFDDAVVEDAHFCIDIHNPDGAGQSETEGCPYEELPYEIPYRSLCPKGFDNLLVAGRAISGDHRAHASYRVMRICMAMGHAAGLAAVQMSDKKCGTREVDLREIQKILRINGEGAEA